MLLKNRAPSSARPFKVAHVLPNIGLGGAELAALDAAKASNTKVAAIFLGTVKNGTFPEPNIPSVQVRQSKRALGIASAFWCGRVLQDLQPDVVVFSLWKTICSFLWFRFRNPQCPVAFLLHSSVSVHLIDWLVTAVMIRLSNEVWADSHVTLDARYPKRKRRKPIRVISFHLHNIVGEPRENPSPEFIFWGRLSALKRIDRAIQSFSRVAARYPQARFRIFGSDQGRGTKLVTLTKELGLSNQVIFGGHQSFDALLQHAKDAHFFLQTSALEGMSMSVAEAMRIGLVPVVTPVGEIGRYCHHLENSIILNFEDCNIDDLLRVLDEPQLYARLSRNAIETWRQAPLYSESFLRAAEDLLNSQTK